MVVVKLAGLASLPKHRICTDRRRISGLEAGVPARRSGGPCMAKQAELSIWQRLGRPPAGCAKKAEKLAAEWPLGTAIWSI